MSLDQSTTYNGLYVCPICGWAVISVDMADHHEACNAAKGAFATKLANSLPEISSTKLGYGSERLTFDFSDTFSITFRVSSKAVAFESMFLSRDIDEQSARDLVATLAAWNKRRGSK